MGVTCREAEPAFDFFVYGEKRIFFVFVSIRRKVVLVLVGEGSYLVPSTL